MKSFSSGPASWLCRVSHHHERRAALWSAAACCRFRTPTRQFYLVRPRVCFAHPVRSRVAKRTEASYCDSSTVCLIARGLKRKVWGAGEVLWGTYIMGMNDAHDTPMIKNPSHVSTVFQRLSFLSGGASLHLSLAPRFNAVMRQPGSSENRFNGFSLKNSNLSSTLFTGLRCAPGLPHLALLEQIPRNGNRDPIVLLLE